MAPLFAGIQPAVLAVILGALWRLGQKAIKSPELGAIAAGTVGLLLLGLSERQSVTKTPKVPQPRP